MTNLAKLQTFVDIDVFNVVVESPRGADVKLKYDLRSTLMGVSRPLPIGTVFPFDWGFVPSTMGPDGDPIDAIVIWDASTFPGVVVECRAAGSIEVEQNQIDGSRKSRVRNDRVLAVPTSDRRSAIGRELVLDRRMRHELENFLVAMTALEGKDVKILGWSGAKATLKYIASHQERQRKRTRS